jgi:hypothetical protein
LVLKGLVDMRAEREDLREVIDDAVKGPAGDKAKAAAASGSSTPPRRSARGAPPPPLTAADVRERAPLGVDAAGTRYHWFDMPLDADAPVGLVGSRLYAEGPPRGEASEQLQLQEQPAGGGGAPDKAAAVAAASKKPPLPPGR